MKSKQSHLGLVLAGLLLSILMASMDNTIVVTAMGTIVGDLGGFDKFVWVTSAYMVTEMAGMPIFGKLSDMFGRKRFFIFGLIVFLAVAKNINSHEKIEYMLSAVEDLNFPNNKFDLVVSSLALHYVE